MKLVSHKLAAFVCCLLIMIASIPTSPAQQTESKQTNNSFIDEKKEETKQKKLATNGSKPEKRRKRVVVKPKREQKTTLTSLSSSPVSLVYKPEFLIGQAKVVVKGNFDPIIRLGLASNGSTVVEFPASDNFFAIHPGGGSNIVSVDESPTLATDHFLVFRAGKDFATSSPNSKQNDKQAATVSVQMESGMFVTLMFYPVSDVTQMAHRLVVVYSREEVVAARRAAGLAVNLNENDTKGDIAQTSANNVNVEKSNTASVNTSEDSKQNTDKNERLVFEVKQALRSVLNAPQKFTSWTKTLHGLSISTLAPVDIDKEHQLVIVAVKNVSPKSLRLIEGQPEMDVLTLNEKGNPVLIQSLTNLYVETTSVDGEILSNSIVYYVLLYEPPVLSVNQRIRFSIANRNAVDEPVTALLSK